MNKSVGTFMKGIATGAVVGTAVGMISSAPSSRRRKDMKRSASKALRAVGDMVQNVQYMMK